MKYDFFVLVFTVGKKTLMFTATTLSTLWVNKAGLKRGGGGGMRAREGPSRFQSTPTDPKRTSPFAQSHTIRPSPRCRRQCAPKAQIEKPAGENQHLDTNQQIGVIFVSEGIQKPKAWNLGSPLPQVIPGNGGCTKAPPVRELQ